MFPTRRQWKKWGLLSKYGAIGFFITLIMALVTVYTLFHPKFFEEEKKINKNLSYFSKNITRADFLAKAMRVIIPNVNFGEVPSNLPDKYFMDIRLKTYKYYKEIYYAWEHGIISKNPRFTPNYEIKKKEMAVILSNIICIAINGQSESPSSCANKFKGKSIVFKDLDDEKLRLKGFKPFVNHLLSLNLIKRGLVFSPNSPISIQEANDIISQSKIISNILSK